MSFSTFSLSKLALVAAAFVSQVTATTVRIDVSTDGDAGPTRLVFTPNTTTAAVGDVLEYHYHGATHSVAMSDFDSPCNPAKTGGFFSGVFSTVAEENPNVFRVTVNSTDPIFYYCTVAGHCQAGMAGVVNPTSDQTLVAYKANAKSTTSSAPAGVFGGEVVAAGADSGSSSSSTPSSSTTSAPSASGAGSATTTSSAPSATETEKKNGAATLTASLVTILGAIGAAVLMA
ncbi:hypothetical protein B0T17DRAFT_608125 [Bombardia bombarda]|uniref:Extracellular serine-rich protein n=1 Tax=Bombardia bombarda TaxID=252184 RepID=A0AA39X156_9PEZI|nr:hypothetical protein B0T17DRAFT_608125 [Bombardia bombarda]